MLHFRKRIGMTSSPTDFKSTFVTFLTSIVLQHSGLFRTIADLQRAFDPLDIEGLQHLWSTLQGTDIPLGANIPEPGIEDWSRFTSAYPAADLSDLPNAAGRGSTGLHALCLAQLLSGTFKDCSVILRPDGDLENATAHVIDLDPKSVTKLSKWVELDRTIVDAFKSAGVDKKCNCIN